jgi:osmotically inducible protein OsmC
MAFSAELGKAGFTPASINTTATVTLDKTDAGFTVTESHLDMTAKVPGIDAAKFTAIANGAKAGCPISRLLKANITLDAKLEG